MSILRLFLKKDIDELYELLSEQRNMTFELLNMLKRDRDDFNRNVDTIKFVLKLFCFGIFPFTVFATYLLAYFTLK